MDVPPTRLGGRGDEFTFVDPVASGPEPVRPGRAGELLDVGVLAVRVVTE